MAGDEPVPRSQIVKGYEYEKGKYVLIEDADLEKIKLETNKTIEITQFADQSELDPIYLGTPYYAAPDGAVAAEPFCVIRQAMQAASKVGIGRVVMHNKEHLVALAHRGEGFLISTLRYAEEIRSAAPYYEDIKNGDVDKSQLELAEQLINALTKPFDHSLFSDRYQDALLELIKAKIDGAEPTVVQEAESTPVFNFMDAIKESVAQSGTRKKPPAKSVRTKKTTRRTKKQA